MLETFRGIVLTSGLTSPDYVDHQNVACQILAGVISTCKPWDRPFNRIARPIQCRLRCIFIHLTSLSMAAVLHSRIPWSSSNTEKVDVSSLPVLGLPGLRIYSVTLTSLWDYRSYYLFKIDSASIISFLERSQPTIKFMWIFECGTPCSSGARLCGFYPGPHIKIIAGAIKHQLGEDAIPENVGFILNPNQVSISAAPPPRC